MRWLILFLVLLNVGYITWAWHDGRLNSDPYANVPPLGREGGAVELLDAWLEVPGNDPAGRDRPRNEVE